MKTLTLTAAAGLVALSATGLALAQGQDGARVTRPAGTAPFAGDPAELVAVGEKLFSDTALSTNEMSCASCHADYGAYAETFREAYPHKVAMADGMFGLPSVDAEQMVQICMVMPMAAQPLAWDSQELAALTAYVTKVQSEFAARPASP